MSDKNILESVSLGEHYFKIAFLLRESLFLNGILFSSESWYGLKEMEIKELEKLDKILLRHIFESPKSVPVSSLFLESGCVSIGTLIKARRVTFLHHLANLDESEMLFKFFKCQWDHPVQLDWTDQARLNLQELNIPVSLNFLKSKSKTVFKKLVKEKIKTFEFSRLMTEKSNKSKLKNVSYSELKMQEYLELKTMNKTQAIVLFKFRVRMSPFGENYKAGQQTPICPFCSLHLDSQEESFSCVKLKSMIQISGKYSDIFGREFKQEFLKTLCNLYFFREEYRKMTN